MNELKRYGRIEKNSVRLSVWLAGCVKYLRHGSVLYCVTYALLGSQAMGGVE